MSNELVQQLEEKKVVGILRGLKAETTEKIITIYKEMGIKFVEVTYNSPSALRIIKKHSRDRKIYMGVGTIKNYQELLQALDAGAQFVVTPNYRKKVVLECRKREIPIICGAFSPSEIYDAYETGADMVKVFPASTLGSEYIRSILGPLSEIKLVPTGGINSKNASQFLKAGATALGIGGGLLDKKAISECNWEKEKEKVKSLLRSIK